MATFWCAKGSYSFVIDEGHSEFNNGRWIVIRPPKWGEFRNNIFGTTDPKVIAKLEATIKLKPGFLTRTDTVEDFEAPLDGSEWVAHKEAMSLGFSPGKLKAAVEAKRVRTREREGKKFYSHYDLTEVLMAESGHPTDKGE